MLIGAMNRSRFIIKMKTHVAVSHEMSYICTVLYFKVLKNQ